MKVMIIGSMAFAKEMLEIQKKLQEMGHEVEVPCDADMHIADPALRDDLARDKVHVLGGNVMHRCFDLVANSDGVLVLNYEHKGVKGYLGTSTLMEIGLAGYLHKKIFIFNPTEDGQRYNHEIDVLGGVFINGDLSKVK